MAVLNTARRPLLDSTVAAFKPRVASSKPKREYFRAASAWLRRNASMVRTGVFATVGFGAPCVAAFEWCQPAGWVAVGVAALLFDKAVNTDERPR